MLSKLRMPSVAVAIPLEFFSSKSILVQRATKILLFSPFSLHNGTRNCFSLRILVNLFCRSIWLLLWVCGIRNGIALLEF